MPSHDGAGGGGVKLCAAGAFVVLVLHVMQTIRNSELDYAALTGRISMLRTHQPVRIRPLNS